MISKRAIKKWLAGFGYNVVKVPKSTGNILKDRLSKNLKMGYFYESEAFEAMQVISSNTMLPYEPLVTLFEQVVYCEKNNIPVAYHTGGGPPMTPYNCCPKFRISLGDPFLIEDVLIRYPKLQVYLMHGGENFFENTVRMMKMYTHLYIDLGVLLWVDPFASTDFPPWARG